MDSALARETPVHRLGQKPAAASEPTFGLDEGCQWLEQTGGLHLTSWYICQYDIAAPVITWPFRTGRPTKRRGTGVPRPDLQIAAVQAALACATTTVNVVEWTSWPATKKFRS
jgi:hypothetical protein